MESLKCLINIINERKSVKIYFFQYRFTLILRSKVHKVMYDIVPPIRYSIPFVVSTSYKNIKSC